MNKETLNKVTVVIPTRDRYSKLTRLLVFLKKHSPYVNIIVLDSSASKSKNVVLKNILNGEHIVYQLFHEKISLSNKIAKGLQLVQTEYSVMCADDDLIIPDGGAECIKFLDWNPDYSVAHGRYISFLSSSNNGKSKENFYWSRRYDTDSIELESSLERAAYYYEVTTAPNFYGVYRTKLHRIIMDGASKMEEIRFQEHIQAIMSLIHGKDKRLDVFYYAREKVKKKTRLASIGTLINDGIFDKKYEKFKEIILPYLTKETGKDIDICEKRIDSAFSKWVHDSFDNNTKDIGILDRIVSIVRNVGIVQKIRIVFFGKNYYYNKTMSLGDDSMSGIYTNVSLVKQSVLDDKPKILNISK